MELSIGLPEGTDVLEHHDLDNLLEPLASHLGPARIAYASARKTVAATSNLVLGPVSEAAEPVGEWQSATLSSSG